MQRTVLIPSILLVVGGLPAFAGKATVEAADTWAAQIYDRCIASVFALPERTRRLDVSSEWIVTVRRLSDDSPELQITVGSNGETSEVFVIEAKDKPFSQQLVDAFINDRNKANRRGCQVLEVERRHEITRSKYLTTHLARLQSLEIPAVPSSDIWLHADQLQIWITSGVNILSLEIQVPSESENHRHPLILWSSELMNIISKDPHWSTKDQSLADSP